MSSAPRRALSIGAVVLIVIAVLIGWLVFRDSGEATSSDPDTPTMVLPTPTAQPLPDGEQCTPLGEGFIPTEFEIPHSEVISPVLSLGRDESDAAAAPPVDASHTTGWFNEGPRAGSEAGKVLLTIHTYRQGGALGNEMYEDGPKQVNPGDRMLLRDDNGNVACYEVSGIEKIWVDEYDPTSDAIYDNDGDPQIAIVICWDFNHSTEEWDSRIVYYADPVTEGPSQTTRTTESQPSASATQ